jgi:hypothetical protein
MNKGMIKYINSAYFAMLPMVLNGVVFSRCLNTLPMFIMAGMEKAYANLTEKQS